MQGYENLIKYQNKSWIQGYSPPHHPKKKKSMRLAAGLLLLLAGANPEKASRQAGCRRLGLAESRSYIHQRPAQRIACYSLISTDARARTYTPAQIEGEREEELTEETDTWS